MPWLRLKGEGVRCSAVAFAMIRTTVLFLVYVTGFAGPQTGDEQVK